jgi:hypothetical protein
MKKKMKLPGPWKIRVWENLGWHASIETRYIRVYYSEHGGKCTAMVGDEPNSVGDSWSQVAGAYFPSYKDPTRAVKARIQLIVEGMNAMNELVEKITDHVKLTGVFTEKRS